MAELTTTERLQPSLLDRLTDTVPGQREESREQRVISATRLRECVIRDLAWLLNAVNLETSHPLGAYPQVQRSVLNYGIPDLAGVAVTGIDAVALQQRIREAILAFEPRLIADTLRVSVHADATRMDRRSLLFTIESEMWAQPLPLNLYLKTALDLETGRLDVVEGHG
ncbi:type VI secretion system lysozyme [Xanthomonas cucurbitae]|uniref:Type VI secretion system lysozyme n=1 Tax=Xanthomonas cucurbitae TaxID=56453 RepID=A0A2S7DRK7_9XANT|nr:type VI secretion system baseplate subunit TssE [Xanthomonas cucurbitae]PPU76379.1 type VI secretion system lysozyme [Xanthomonas cucurbitae]WDM79332.1 type VI secretion system baseplate subunit TssE [Xanthomonas cucurbitae]WDM83019.1 type VI secretion system baseplate subunit TssE [Xanthomonas cucurbitae]